MTAAVAAAIAASAEEMSGQNHQTVFEIIIDVFD